jgi:hypothetical protein
VLVDRHVARHKVQQLAGHVLRIGAGGHLPRGALRADAPEQCSWPWRTPCPAGSNAVAATSQGSSRTQRTPRFCAAGTDCTSAVVASLLLWLSQQRPVC